MKVAWLSQAYDMVRDFHRTFGLPIREHPQLQDTKEIFMRLRLVREEADELTVAVEDWMSGTTSQEEALVEVTDALADLLYVVYGAAATWGIPLDGAVAEVHRSNMTKLWNKKDLVGALVPQDASIVQVREDTFVVYRGDGKVLKPPTWEEPNLEEVLWG